MVFQGGFSLKQTYYRCNHCCMAYEGGSVIQKREKGMSRRAINPDKCSGRHRLWWKEERALESWIFRDKVGFTWIHKRIWMWSTGLLGFSSWCMHDTWTPLSRIPPAIFPSLLNFHIVFSYSGPLPSPLFALPLWVNLVFSVLLFPFVFPLPDYIAILFCHVLLWYI